MSTATAFMEMEAGNVKWLPSVVWLTRWVYALGHRPSEQNPVHEESCPSILYLLSSLRFFWIRDGMGGA